MKEVLFSICVAAVMTAVYKAIAPTEKFGSQIKLLISCFFVLTVINAVSGLGLTGELLEIPETDTSYNDYSVQIRAMTADETAKVLRTRISEALAEEKIYPEKIYVDVNISDKDSISISEIKLVFGKDDYELYSERAVYLTRRVTGTAIKVTAELTPQSRHNGER